MEEITTATTTTTSTTTISFDEMSTLTREDFLLMLVSTMSGSNIQKKQQKRSLTILKGCGVTPEILDASDKANSVVKQELCDMSGVDGIYPQFFLVQGDQTTFFADYNDLEQMNDDGTLLEWLSMEIPNAIVNAGVIDKQNNSVYKTNHHHHIVEEQDSDEYENELSSVYEPSLKKEVNVEDYGFDEQATVTTHPDTSHGGSSLGSVSYSRQSLQQHSNHNTYTCSHQHYCNESPTNSYEWSHHSNSNDVDGEGGEEEEEGEILPTTTEDENERELPERYQNEMMAYDCDANENADVVDYPDMVRIEGTERANKGHRSDTQSDTFEEEQEEDTLVSQEQDWELMNERVRDKERLGYQSPRKKQQQGQQHGYQSSPSKSPKEDSVIHSEIELPDPSWTQTGTLQKAPQNDMRQKLPIHESLENNDGDSIFDNIANDEGSRYDTKCDEKDVDESPNLHTLHSLLSSDDSVDTTATSSSIVTNSRVTSMDLDLRIQPSTDIHFWLSHSEDTSRCTITLSNMSMSYLPLVYKIRPSQRRPYMVWPSVGVIKPQTTMSINVFLLDDAKQELLNKFQKLGPAAEFCQKDTLAIEWCGVPSDFCNQLTGDHDQDVETLWSYWNTCQKEDGWSSEKSVLRVRVSVDDKTSQQHRPALPGSPPLTSKEFKTTTQNDIPHNVSIDSHSSNKLEIEQQLQAEVENLRRKCEELTAERYIMEQQLEEVREKNSPPRGGAIHKFQLQQTMRCGNCLKVFKSDPSSLMAPIASQSCGHSICRNCCHRRASSRRRRQRSNQRQLHSLSSDLLMCVGDVQSISLNEDCCPICHAPSAFGSANLHVNQSLCLVLKLLDS